MSGSHSKEWNAAHKKEMAMYKKRYKERHPERAKEQSDRSKRTLQSRYSHLYGEAKRNHREFTISFEEFKEIASQSCFYCNGKLPETGGGIDRINSSVGYVSGNCRPCCTNCNLSKNDLTETEFKDHTLAIYNNWIVRK